jgi:streptogramin lyase
MEKRLAILMLAALAACGGAQTARLLPQLAAAPEIRAPAVATVAVKITIAASGATAGRKDPRYFSRSSAGVLVQAYAHASKKLLAQKAVDVSPGSKACRGSSAPVRTCVAFVSVPVTSLRDDFAVGDYNVKPKSGRIPKAAALLAVGRIVDAKVRASKANAFTVYLGGVVAGFARSSGFVSLPGDGSPHAVALVFDPVDFGNNPISAGKKDPLANPVSVSLAETDGIGHALLSLDGGVGSTTVTVKYSSDTVVLDYDGGGSPGYGMTVTLRSAAVRGFGGASETVNVSPLFIASSSAEYTAPVLALSGNGDTLTLNLSELNAPPGTQYSLRATNCAAIAATYAFAQASASSASGVVMAQPVISTPPPGSGCVIAASDGTSVDDVDVTNAYKAVLGTPTIQLIALPTANLGAKGIAAAPDGSIWFAEDGANTIARLPSNDPATAAIVEHPLPNNEDAIGIDAGPDGNVWYANCSTNTVGKMTSSGVIGSDYALADPPYEPRAVVDGADGSTWFTDTTGVGRVTAGAAMTYFSNGITGGAQYGIALGPDGNLWFTECATSRIGKITPAGVVTEFALPGYRPFGITAGPDGAMWFTECSSNKVARIPVNATSASQITQYVAKSPGAGPYFITTGPDGALWFTEFFGNAIGRLDPSSAVPNTSNGMTEYAIPFGSNAEPWGIVAGPDAALWFTNDYSGVGLGRLTL